MTKLKGRGGGAMREQVFKKIGEASKELNFEKTTATYISEILGISRSVVSQYLNALYGERKLVKINTRPVYYLDVQILSYIKPVTVYEFDSIETFNIFFERDEKKDFHKLVGFDKSLSKIVKQCKSCMAYPPKGIPVLLHGPTGCGKSYFAKLMYEYAKNHKIIKEEAKFVIVNCSEYANNPELLTANLFGHIKGAFTGADKDNPGLLQIADGGILFLDEVHGLRSECQEKLFLFMDQGVYHRMGDNEKWYQSNVHIIFATTENPANVLLKTLLRRIPMIIEIPSLQDRGMSERAQFIYMMYQKEEDRIHRKIKISNLVFNALMRADFKGNVGALENCIKASCVNAILDELQEDVMEIHLESLPEEIQESLSQEEMVEIGKDKKLISVKELKSLSKLEHPLFKLLQIIFSDFIDYENHILDEEQFIEKVRDMIQESVGMFQEENKNSKFEDCINKEIKYVRDKYGAYYSLQDITTITILCDEFQKNKVQFMAIEKDSEIQVQSLLSYLQKNHYREYEIAKELCESLEMSLDTKLGLSIVILLALILNKIHDDKNMRKRIGVILAHGNRTASSIAEAVNKFLGHYIFDAVDMPVEESVQEVIRKLNMHLDKIGNFEEIALLVDMGSLEDIYKGLENRNAKVAIMNNVNTKLALEAGNGLLQGESFEQMFERMNEYNKSSYKIIDARRKERVIVCSCASGIGAAEKLRDIIAHSIPKNIAIKTIIYDYNTLLENQKEDSIFNKYEVICVIGTLNPNLDGVKFIAVEDLILSDTLNTLDVYFKDELDSGQFVQFKRNILENFSLSNIMENLTILNPNKLLEHVAKAIDKLQLLEGATFSSHICFGLYVHICCLIERLVTQNGIQDYQDTNKFIENHRKFIENVKEAFNQVELFYGIEINVEEIGYIHDYISNN